ncbi:MAG: N-acetylmuramoyl-L-alanine amidase [Negativicoccus succinicivorans]|nr:N-acetylmuramoyl-L-alanine amidase [Negativicoccus succinicivorans]
MILAEIRQLNQLDGYIYQGRDYINKITLHWTATAYDEVDFSEYHITISGSGRVFVTRQFNERGAHTWQRNTGNLGIALACCGGTAPCIWADGTVAGWGSYPPTNAQVEKMAEVVAYTAIGLGVPAVNIQDHHHWARLDGYGCDRVDIMRLPQENGTGRDIIVGKARYYANKWGLSL